MAVHTVQNEGSIAQYCWGNRNTDGWSSWNQYNTPVMPTFNASSVLAYEIKIGDGVKTSVQFDCLFSYAIQSGDVYFLSMLPSALSSVPNLALAHKTLSSEENVHISLDGLNHIYKNGYLVFMNTSSGGNSGLLLSNVSATAEFDDTVPTVEIVYPKDNEEKNNYEDISFYARVTPPEGIWNYDAEMQSSYNQNDWSNPIFDYSTNSRWIRANTFHAGSVYWRCRAKTAYSSWSNWTDASFIAVERLPTVSSLSPNNKYIDRTNETTLVWQSSCEGGTITGSEIEYDLGDGEGWKPLGTVTGNTTEYIVSANTFSACNNISWRVRSKNGNNKYGEWVSATFSTIDAPISVVPLSPINGAARDETATITLSWSTSSTLGSQPTGADLQWRLPQGNWQTLGSVEGAEKSFSVSANTFPGSVIYWRVRAYNQDGTAGNWSSEANFTTVDAPSVASPIAPIGTIEDTDDNLLFRWSTSSSSGTPPTRADLQYSYDGSSWIDLGQTDGTQYLNVVGGTIHAGTVQWRVRSYNRNGTAGVWSNPASFSAHAAPRILDITADSKPFTTITWQATDQQTYEIVIDNQVTYGSFFGEEKSFQLPDYLEDGTHTVKIRVQNAMSMWSKWGELSFSVLNDPGEEIHLTGDFDVDAELFWADESDYADYLVYRDGILIAETPNRFFSDRVVLGEHAYYVVNRFTDGYYSKSNEVECTLNTDTPLVAFLSGGEWMPLEKSENPQQSQRFTRTRVVAYHHFSGDKNPTPEVGDEEDLVAEYDAAWFYTEEGSKKLKSMVGQALIIKSRGEEVVIGVLEGYSKVNRKHFRGFAFNLKQMEWKDYICVE